MSKRALKKYLTELDKESLEEQLMDLYGRFPSVKTYYDFVFNPQEQKLLDEARAKISEEYFPRRRKRAKGRRSVAHKLIKHFINLGMDPSLLSDLMAFNLETCLRYEREKRCPEAFYRSIYKSYREWGAFLVQHRLLPENRERFTGYADRISDAGWPDAVAFMEFQEYILS